MTDAHEAVKTRHKETTSPFRFWRWRCCFSGEAASHRQWSLPLISWRWSGF